MPSLSFVVVVVLLFLSSCESLIMRSHLIPNGFSLHWCSRSQHIAYQLREEYFDRIYSQWMSLRVVVWCMKSYCCCWHCHRKYVDHPLVWHTMWSASSTPARFRWDNKLNFRSCRNHLNFQNRPIDWRTTNQPALSSISCGWISIFYQMNCHIDIIIELPLSISI